MWGYIGGRDCPYGICRPWVRGGWDLDALGKLFRRRRRRCRRPRLRVLLLLGGFLLKVVFLVISYDNYIFGHLFSRRLFLKT